MSMPGQKVLDTVQQVQQEQMQRVQTQKVLSGLRAGIELLESKTVVAPIAMHEGLTDLKWILQNLLGGKFSLDFAPKREPIETIVGRPLPGYDPTMMEPSPEGAGGEDKT